MQSLPSPPSLQIPKVVALKGVACIMLSVGLALVLKKKVRVPV
jgi:hypothetical protein